MSRLLALVSLLVDSGDLTPEGARQLIRALNDYAEETWTP